MFQNKCISNLSITNDFQTHNHKEAGMLLIFYGIYIAKNDPFQKLVGYCPGWEVSVGELSWGKCPSGYCPDTSMM